MVDRLQNPKDLKAYRRRLVGGEAIYLVGRLDADEATDSFLVGFIKRRKPKNSSYEDLYEEKTSVSLITLLKP